MPATCLLLAWVLAGCPRVRVEREGRPCEAGRCADGYVCSPLSDRCVRPVVIDCTGGVCPSSLATGDPCEHVGAFVPCADHGAACADGCRVCAADRTWGGCLVDGCDLGRLEACGDCADDCSARVRHAVAVCDRRGARPVCGLTACEAGWRDADRNPGNGCETPECAPSCADRCGGADGCGGSCPTVDCVEPESCGGGGAPGFCGWWWSCDWRYRRALTVVAPAGHEVPAGYAVSVIVNHAAWVEAGRALASGDDLRIVRWTGSGWDELERVADPLTPFDDATRPTELWFRLAAPLAPGATDGSYFLYYGAPTAGQPPADETAVFPFADFFARADSAEVGGGWTVVDGSTGFAGDLALADGRLVFAETGDTLYNRPLAQHDFTPPSGDLLYRVGFDWTGAAGDTWYRVMLQLGAAASMDDPPGPAQADSAVVGVGVSLVWAGDSTGGFYQRLFCESGGLLSDDCGGATVSGATEIAVTVDVAAKTYDVAVAGVTTKAGMAFSTAVTSLDRVRFATRGVANAVTSHRAFDYVLVRSRLAIEPGVAFAAEEAHTCP